MVFGDPTILFSIHVCISIYIGQFLNKISFSKAVYANINWLFFQFTDRIGLSANYTIFSCARNNSGLFRAFIGEQKPSRSNSFCLKRGVNMSKAKALLHGFVDTHVHAGPTLTVREFDIWQLIQEAETGGFAAVVLKDHFIPTVPIARAIQEKLFETPVKIFGSLALNNSVGGINPKAVEGMTEFLNLLREAGVASDNLKQMISINPAALMGLKTDHF